MLTTEDEDSRAPGASSLRSLCIMLDCNYTRMVPKTRSLGDVNFYVILFERQILIYPRLFRHEVDKKDVHSLPPTL